MEDFADYQEKKSAFWSNREAFNGVDANRCDFALRRFFVDSDDYNSELVDEYVHSIYYKELKPTLEMMQFCKSYLEVEDIMKNIMSKYRFRDRLNGAMCAISDCVEF